jgi:hypothetical protein
VFDDSPPGMRKLLGAAPVVAAGLIVGSCANAILCSENGTDEIQRMIV